MLVARRAGCLGAVGSLAVVRVPARPPSCTLEVATQAFRSDGQGDSHRHREADEDARRRGSDLDDDLCLHHLPVHRRPDEPAPRRSCSAATTAAAAQGSGVEVKRKSAVLPTARVACQRSHAPRWLLDYVFGGLDPDAAPSLIDGAQTPCAAPRRVDARRGRPEPLKRGLIARIRPYSTEDHTA